MQVWIVIGVGVLVHVVFFFSIFEIYFSTPLMTGMTPHKSPIPPRARRLVFIVADGLRADKVLELLPDGKSPAPFLRNIIETKGAWGISHAAVPTATRPGHVALTAGFYEDPTSVAKDLQGKAVLFDTVFNESRYTWSWDTPQFLAKVTGGDTKRFYSKKYPGDMKWLTGMNAAEMDSWVFDEAQRLFKQTKLDKDLKSKMDEDQILFFLHLGGLDHSGYIVRPNSQAYIDHISLVDRGIQQLVEDMDRHYNNDGKTAYVFTSDHGMTDWGAHGDGTPDETLTPLVAWGPGIRGPEPETGHQEDQLSESFKLSHKRRSDIRQGNMAAFLTSLIGLNFPMNAIFPIPEGLYNLTDQEMAELLFANLRQLFAQFEAMESLRREESIKLTFKPFKPLAENRVGDTTGRLRKMIDDKHYADAIKEIKFNIQLAQKGIRYFQTYDRFPLWFGIICSYIGWMVYVMTVLAEEYTNKGLPGQGTQLSRRVRGFVIAFFSLVSAIIFCVLYAQSTLWTNYIYILLPCPLWMVVCLRIENVFQLFSVLPSLKTTLPYILLSLVGLECIVIGFYHMEVLSLVLVCLGVWPWIMKKHQIDKKLLFHWLASCLTLSFFPLLPTRSRELNFNLVVFGGVLVIAVACFLVKTFAAKQLAKRKLFLIFGFQIAVIAVSVLIVRHTAEMAATNKRTPLLNQVLSWIFLGLGLIEPFLVTTEVRCRLLTIALAWISPFILFSISYELLYMLSLCWNLYTWMLIEASTCDQLADIPYSTKAVANGNGVHSRGTSDQIRFVENLDFATITNQISGGKSRLTLEKADIRRAFYFIFLVFCSLFGTGNIASVNSFDPAAVFCFLTVTHPPSMALLMILKLIIPFLLVSCIVRAVNLLTQVPIKSYHFLVILMTDIIALHFFLLVSDEGTWFQVGQSISHYVIFMITNVVIMLLFGVSYLLTTCNICCFRS